MPEQKSCSLRSGCLKLATVSLLTAYTSFQSKSSHVRLIRLFPREAAQIDCVSHSLSPFPPFVVAWDFPFRHPASRASSVVASFSGPMRRSLRVLAPEINFISPCALAAHALNHVMRLGTATPPSPGRWGSWASSREAVLHRDPSILVINKPAGLASQAS